MTKRHISKQSSAVITGAGSGIGRAFALALAHRGGKVVCADINLTTAQETVDLITALGGQAVAIQCDVSVLASVEALAVDAEAWFGGPVDLIVNNAGVGVGGKGISEVSIDDWCWTLGINLWGVIHGCHVFAPKLKAQGFGGIINVCSTASFAAAPTMGPYNVSKAAALALTETLSAELSGTGIHVTALCPTFVKTNIVRDGRIDANASQMGAKIMEWVGFTPERVVEMALAGLDKNQLYVLPQMDARMIWRSKRLVHALYARGAGLINRFALKAQ